MEEASVSDSRETVSRKVVIFVEAGLQFKHPSLVLAKIFAHLNIYNGRDFQDYLIHPLKLIYWSVLETLRIFKDAER